MSPDLKPSDTIDKNELQAPQDQPAVQTELEPTQTEVTETVNKNTLDDVDEEEIEWMAPPKPPLDTPRGKVSPNIAGKPKPKPR